jgi:hypothetical protein
MTEVLTSKHLYLNGITGFPDKKEYAPQIIYTSEMEEHTEKDSHYTGLNVHNGQRKLLVSEVQLLTRVYDSIPKTTPLLCVYAGAFPCLHLTQLLVNFPHTFFLLIDPAFQLTNHLHVWPGDRVVLCKSFFDVDEAKAVKNWVKGSQDHHIHRALNQLKLPYGMNHNNNLVFISDVRRDAVNRYIIDEEMTEQAMWFHTMDAKAGLVKFRLPYGDATFMEEYADRGYKYDYMKGIVYLPIWGRKSTTECRLYVERGCGNDTYYPIELEKSMAGFNTTNRCARFSVNRKTYKSFDEAAETLVLYQYSYTMGREWKWWDWPHPPVLSEICPYAFCIN